MQHQVERAPTTKILGARIGCGGIPHLGSITDPTCIILEKAMSLNM
jgi:hypothetical protein